MPKRPLGLNVLEAAEQRICQIFDDFPRIYLSFSGGKDSTVLLHLVMAEAAKRQRRIGLLFIDLEAQYRLTIEHVEACYHRYADQIEPFWIALPMILRNAVSMYEPRWLCWDPDKQETWVRQPHPLAITEEAWLPFFRRGMEFEEFVEAFGYWYGQQELTACLVAIRADESLNRFRTLIAEKSRYADRSWSTYKGQTVYNFYPIYDWRTEDLWTYHGRTGLPYNRLYDLMYQAGLSIHQSRICQPYGDDQRKGLWLYHVIEPDTWPKVVARVNGANSGALYAREVGNILGRIKIDKPPGHTWQSFAKLLLASLPPASQEHFSDKILVFLKWWQDRGYPQGIPDVGEAKQEASKEIPSWRRICKVLLRNDWWCKGLSFSQTRSETYLRWKKIMDKRRRAWGIHW